MREIWVDVKDYEGLYQVSNYGRVKSLDRFIIQKDRWGNDRKRLLKGKILTLKLVKSTKRSNKGYLQVHLWKNGNGKYYCVNRLVWSAFNGEIPEGLQVNHIDENPFNNCIWNLNLMTCEENNNYGTRNERISASLRGRKRPSEIFEKISKPIEAVNEDGEIIYSFISISEADRNGFSKTAIRACCKNKYWNKKGNNFYRGLIWRYANENG